MLDQVQFSQTQAAHHAQAPSSAQAAAVMKGPGLSVLMQDMAEELSFALSDKLDEEDFSEKLEDRDSLMRLKLIEQLRELYDGLAQPEAEKIKENLHRFKSAGELIAMAYEQAKGDAGLAYAILADLASTPPENAPAFVAEAPQLFAEQNIDRLTAARNTYKVASSLDKSDEAKALHAFYQDNIDGFESVLTTATRIVDQLGGERVHSAFSFLDAAARAELDEPLTAVQPEKLEKLLIELQGGKLVRTMQMYADNLERRFAARRGFEQALDKPLENFIKTAAERGYFNAKILPTLHQASPTDRALFMQDTLSAIRNLPDWTYEGDLKPRIAAPIQSELDRLVLDEGA